MPWQYVTSEFHKIIHCTKKFFKTAGQIRNCSINLTWKEGVMEFAVYFNVGKLLCFFLSWAISTSKNNSWEKQRRGAIELHNSVANKFTDNLAATKYRRVLKEMTLKFAWLKRSWTWCNTQINTLICLSPIVLSILLSFWKGNRNWTKRVVTHGQQQYVATYYMHKTTPANVYTSYGVIVSIC